jgi:hypothetical protein
MPRLLFLVLPAALLAALPARAEGPPPSGEKAWENEKPTRRGGFTAGIAVGAGLASFAGFPNDAKKIGYARYYTATGASLSSTFSLWLGGALSDWFVFGIGFTGSSMPFLQDQKATSGGLLFHVESFPLFPLGGKLRDVGVTLDFGTGSATVTGKTVDDKLIDGGGCSLFGGGVFYEGIRFWKMAMGPFVSGNYYWKDTVRRPAIFAGWQTSLYTGPSK